MRKLLLAAACVWLASSLPTAGVRQTAAPEDGVASLLQRLEKAIGSGDPGQYLPLLSAAAVREQALRFAQSTILPGTTRAVVRERDRAPLKGALPGRGHSVLVDVLIESGNRARLSTWRLEVRQRSSSPDDGSPAEWGIAEQESLSTLHGLYRLSLNPLKQFAATDVTIADEDFELTLRNGSVFVAEAGLGPTALVLLGSGSMVFRPAPAAERGQVRIFTGSETLQTEFDAAMIRLNPVNLPRLITRGTLDDRAVDGRDFGRADAVFREHIGKSFGLDLTDLSPEPWSLVPGPGDFLAEVRTKRFATLTYAHSSGEPEDISLFDRRRRRNISLYASRAKLATEGMFYDEDDLADYDLQHLDIEASFDVGRLWIEGRTTMRLVTRGRSLASLTLRLAEPLALRSVVSAEHGRLLAVKVRNQNSVVVNLPETVPAGTEMALSVAYGGRLEPQPTDREIIALDQDLPQEAVEIPLEPAYLYSNRSYWYPQASSSDYATATMKLTVPPSLSCVASGELVTNALPARPGQAPTGKPDQDQSPRTYIYATRQPVRYLSVLISRLQTVATDDIRAGLPSGHAGAEAPADGFSSLAVRVEAHPRLQGRGRALLGQASDILRFYSALLGDFPYPRFTAAVVERQLPGGHSPAYVAIINQPRPAGSLSWQGDPASFPEFAEFFLAHEIAHQWWGQAVGWKNYHEQWLSEGLSQYFALLYAERARGPSAFQRIVRQVRNWAMRESDEGAVYLGYRVGHIKSDGRLFRAVVYNKSAAVLHMLRRLIGDEAFFGGIRTFYREWRFRKAGSEDLRAALELASGVSLERFFTRWIYEPELPDVAFSWRTAAGASGQEAVVRFEQNGETFDFPVTVTLVYADRPSVDLTVKVTDRVVEARLPLAGQLTRVEVNRDEATVAAFRQ